MNRNYIVLGLIIAVLLMGFGCTSQSNDSVGKTDNISGELYTPVEQTGIDLKQKGAEGKDVQVEVFTFRGNTECHSCITLGELTKNTINKYFANELKSGELTYEHLNVQDPRNRDIAVEYQVTGVSLQIGTTIDGVKTRENLQKVWYYLEDEQGFEDYLMPILQKRLRGELN